MQFLSSQDYGESNYAWWSTRDPSTFMNQSITNVNSKQSSKSGNSKIQSVSTIMAEAATTTNFSTSNVKYIHICMVYDIWDLYFSYILGHVSFIF